MAEYSQLATSATSLSSSSLRIERFIPPIHSRLLHFRLGSCTNDPGIRCSVALCYLTPSSHLCAAAGLNVSLLGLLCCVIYTHWLDTLCYFTVPDKLAFKCILNIYLQMLFSILSSYCLYMVSNQSAPSDLWPLTPMRRFLSTPAAHFLFLEPFWRCLCMKSPREILRLKGSKPQKLSDIGNVAELQTLRIPLPSHRQPFFLKKISSISCSTRLRVCPVMPAQPQNQKSSQTFCLSSAERLWALLAAAAHISCPPPKTGDFELTGCTTSP